jgi:branched-chain amino acid transport system substrate-binding protein
MKRYFVVLLAMLIIVGMVWIISSAPEVVSQTKGEPVKIGYATWLGAQLKTVGYPQLLGAKLAVKEINDRGGILGGRKVELLQYEQGVTGESAVTAAKKALADGCVGIAGFTDATLAVAAQGVLMNKVPFIAAGPGTGELYESPITGWGCSCCPGRGAVRAMGRWVEDHGFKRVVFVGFDSKFCIWSEKWLRELWGRPESKTKLLKSMIVPMTASQVKLEATEAVSLKPDFIVWYLWGDPCLLSGVGTMRQLGSKISWTAVYNVMDDRTIKLLGPDLCNGSWQQFSWLPDLSVPANKAYVQSFMETYKNEQPQYREPDPWSVVNYEATMALLLALDKAGTTSNLKKIHDALYSLNWITPHGSPFKILPSGEFYYENWWLAELQDGKLVKKTPLPLRLDDYYQGGKP